MTSEVCFVTRLMSAVNRHMSARMLRLISRCSDKVGRLAGMMRSLCSGGSATGLSATGAWAEPLPVMLTQRLRVAFRSI
jgi:hypothetical protein